MWIRLAVANVLLVGLLVSGGAAHGGGTGIASTREVGSVLTTSPRASACPLTHPWPLTVFAETPNELAYLSQIDACTDTQRSQLWLRNRSDMVWIPSVTGGGTVYQIAPGASSFSAALQYPYAVLVPGDAVIVDASPELVSWKFNVGMSAAWESRDYLWNWALSTGLQGAFNNRSLRVGSAVATCLLAVRSAVDLNQAKIANGWVGASAYVSSVLSTGVGATKCGQGLRQVAIDYKVRVPNYLLELTASDFTHLKLVDSLMTKMLRAQRWSKYVLLLFG